MAMEQVPFSLHHPRFAKIVGRKMASGPFIFLGPVGAEMCLALLFLE